MVKSEKLFLEKYSDKNKTYVSCGSFKFKNGEQYTPDFYCTEDDQYIEVIGSPSQYRWNAYKYIKMEIEFPDINFIVINVSKTKLSELQELRKLDHIKIRIKHVLQCPQCDSKEIRPRINGTSYCREMIHTQAVIMGTYLLRKANRHGN
jgi:hypothetical protein